MSVDLSAFDLTGRVSVVTGGATGIGFSIAKGLAHAGAAVIIASRNKQQLEQSVELLKAETGSKNIGYYQVDLAKREETEKLVPYIIETHGRLDVLIGNAAQDQLKTIDDIDDAIMDMQIEINLTSNIVLTRAAAPYMKKQGYGRIIFITSIAANVGTVDGIGVYAATKSGLHGFTRVAALELGIDGITVNCIAPGFTMTAMIEEFMDSLGEAGKAYREKSASTTAMNRWASTDEMVGPVLLCASEAGSFITGTVTTVDGGTSVRMN